MCHQTCLFILPFQTLGNLMGLLQKHLENENTSHQGSSTLQNFPQYQTALPSKAFWKQSAIPKTWRVLPQIATDRCFHEMLARYFIRHNGTQGVRIQREKNRKAN